MPDPEDRPRRNVLLTIEYDGTDFNGWQHQPGLRTVEGEVRCAIETALGERVTLTAASRTDRGVHAVGQAAGFVTSSPVPVERLPLVLGAELPDDVRIRRAREMDPSFHPRFDAFGKVYRYTFIRGREERVFLRRLASRVPVSIDAEAMKEAAPALVGEHDFRSFQSASKAPPESTVRRIFAVDVTEEGPLIHVLVAGSGFLYKMVRAIAGTLLEVGLGRRAPGSLEVTLAARDRRAAGPTAEARGLCLLGVCYSASELERALETTGFLGAFVGE